MTEAALEKRSQKLTIPALDTIAETGLAQVEQNEDQTRFVGALQLIHAIAETPELEVLDSGFDGKVITIKVKSPHMTAEHVTIFDGGQLRGSGKIKAISGEDDTYQISINGNNAQAHMERPLSVHVSGKAKPEAPVNLPGNNDVIEAEKKRLVIFKELKATTSEQIRVEDPMVVALGEPRTFNLKQLGLEDGWLGYIQFYNDAAFRPRAVSDTQIEISPIEVGMGTFTFQVVQKTGEEDGKPVYKYTGVEVRVFVEPAQDILPPEPAVTPKDWGIPQDGQDATDVSNTSSIPEMRILDLLKQN